ncbi:MAG: hypothetical protein WBQ73_00055 [Candidatus Babeliales bacterium]
MKKSIWLLLPFLFFIASCSFNRNNKKSKVDASTIIILNGPSASGKSSIQEAFIRKVEDPWVKIGIDNFFVGVLSNYYIFGEYTPRCPQYNIMAGVASQDQYGNPLFTLDIGPAGEKIIDGMNHAIKAYADTGNNIIVDYIAYEPRWLEQLIDLLSDHEVILIKVTVPLSILEEREALRATSPRGHARSHYDSIHKHSLTYDLEIDTSQLTPEEAAEVMCNFLDKDVVSSKTN